MFDYSNTTLVSTGRASLGYLVNVVFTSVIMFIGYYLFLSVSLDFGADIRAWSNKDNVFHNTIVDD